jgi:hypothetical protein
MKDSPKGAILVAVRDCFQLSHDGIDYLPTNSANATGALLFGLRPRGIHFEWNQSFKRFMQQVQTAAWALHMYAHRECVGSEFQKDVEVEMMTLIAEATALAPTPETAVIAHNLIVKNLGPACAYLLKETT